MAVQHEQFLVLGGAKPVEEHSSPAAHSFRTLGEDRLDELRSQILGRHPGAEVIPARRGCQARSPCALIDGKQRLV